MFFFYLTFLFSKLFGPHLNSHCKHGSRYKVTIVYYLRRHDGNNGLPKLKGYCPYHKPCATVQSTQHNLSEHNKTVIGTRKLLVISQSIGTVETRGRVALARVGSYTNCKVPQKLGT